MSYVSELIHEFYDYIENDTSIHSTDDIIERLVGFFDDSDHTTIPFELWLECQTDIGYGQDWSVNELDLLIWIYQNCRCNMDYISENLEIILFCDNRKEKRSNLIKKYLKNKIDEKGYITLYRGFCEKSFPADKAISFTTNYEKAKWFANRYLIINHEVEEAKVMTIKTHIDNVFHYTNRRKEFEAMIVPYDLGNKFEVVKVDTVLLSRK